ncbi:MAG TPA: TIGR01777 family oxidoreductase [Gemmatimonadales bacterium]|nr:TIGR01777 family oxidoreductase [Gemmatimonadales bacterium]
MSQVSPLRVAVTGASGLIGSMLVPALSAAGHEVIPLVRRTAGAGEIQWDPCGTGPAPGALAGVSAVIHLAGENIAGGRWSESRKKAILESRKAGTRLIAEAVAGAGDGPKVLVSASAIGYYGDRGDEELTESSPPGTGFLPQVCQAWESATKSASDAGVRVVMVRTGLVLSRAGGVLQKMLAPFRLGVGGRLGSGREWMSWISMTDLIGVYRHALEGSFTGPVNAVAPGAVRNEAFTEALGRALHRPTILPVPKTALRILFGQMADEAILASAHVFPVVLGTSGFRFRHPELEQALAHELGLTS